MNTPADFQKALRGSNPVPRYETRPYNVGQAYTLTGELGYDGDSITTPATIIDNDTPIGHTGGNFSLVAVDEGVWTLTHSSGAEWIGTGASIAAATWEADNLDTEGLPVFALIPHSTGRFALEVGEHPGWLWTNLGNDENPDWTQEVRFQNGSRLRPTSNGLGMEMVCSADYVYQWQAGNLFVKNPDNFTIREARYMFAEPGVNDDSSAGYVAGGNPSRYVHEDGREWVCADATEGEAVWTLNTSDAASIGKSVTFLERFNRLPCAAITSSSVANPTVITTTTPHGLTTGDVVGIAGHASSTPTLTGQHTITVLSTTTFTVPVNVTAGSTGGTVGKVVKSEESPLVGSAWRQNIRHSGQYPFVVPNAGLRAAGDTLLYMGTEHAENITSMAMLVEWKPSLTPGAVPLNSITIALSASQLLNAVGGGIYLPGRMMHMTINRNGSISMGLGTGEGGVNWTNTTSSRVVYADAAATNPPTMGWPYNTPSMLRIELETGRMRVHVPGAVHEFLDSRFNSDLIGKHWWWEVGGDTFNGAAYKEVPYLQKVWLNSRILDLTPGEGSQPYSTVLDRLTSALPSLPQRLRIMADLAAFPTGNGDGTDGLEVAGSGFFGGHVKARPWSGQTTVKAALYMTSSAAETDSTTSQTLSTAWVSVGILPLSTDGDFAESKIYGNFPNGNNKELAIDVLGGQVFTTGTIADTGAWEMTITRHRRTSAKTNQLHIKFQTSARTIMGYHDGNGEGQPRLRCLAATANGDVRVRCFTGFIVPK